MFLWLVIWGPILIGNKARNVSRHPQKQLNEVHVGEVDVAVLIGLFVYSKDLKDCWIGV